MLLIQKIISTISFFLLTTDTDAARILALLPYPSYSHQVANNVICRALLERGHELTVFTGYPTNNKMPNYTEYSLNHIVAQSATPWSFMEISNEGAYQKSFLHQAYKVGDLVTDDIFSNPLFRGYLSPNTTEKFDLIILESGYWDGLYYLADKLNAPLIVVTTVPGTISQFFSMNSPLLVAEFPGMFTDLPDEMNFWQRVKNLYHNLRSLYEHAFIVYPAQQAILRKHFGNDIPSVSELQNRISMMFVMTHPVLNYPRPMVPTMLQIGGLRLGTMNRTLPVKLKNMLDNAKQGFIYFNLGSNVRSTDLAKDVLNSMIEVFSELPYLILWKFESDTLRERPKNVFINKWMPQEGVLAHPNIKLFIYQGGMQSTEEAIDGGVPLLGMPVMADQWFNIRALIKKGVALSLNPKTMTKEKFKSAINELVLNPRYKENMMKLRDFLYDKLEHPLETVVWWTEHVIKYRGLPHLQSHRLPWYKASMLDIYLFFLVLSILVISTIWKLLQLIICVVMNMRRNYKKIDKVKNS